MLAKHRKTWFAAILPFLFWPLIAQIASHRVETAYTYPQGWRQIPSSIDAYLDENFGLRAGLLVVNARLRYALRSPTTPRVAYGKDGWLFLTDDAAIQQSMGERMRIDQVTAMADLAAYMQHELNARGAKFIVAVPPNSQSVNTEMLPDWAENKGKPTEYDLFRGLLAVRDVNFVDLKQLLLEEKNDMPVYLQTDTHWNNHGALLAFNEIMRGLGHQDWVLDPDEVEKGFGQIGGGDLARMIGMADDLHDWQMQVDVLPVSVSAIDLGDRDVQSTYVDTRDPADPSMPTIMIFGDSFTRAHFRDWLMMHARRLIWTHHRQCGFDWSLLETYKPDIVIFAPTERYGLCAKGRVPANLPR